MLLEDSLIPLAVFASIVGIIWMLVAGTVRIMTMRTLRETARTSPESLGTVAARLGAPATGVRSETIGLLGMAMGAALAVAGLIGDPVSRTLLIQTALLPGFMGAALFGQRWLPRKSTTPQQLPEA